MKENGWKMMAVAGVAALGGVMWSQVIAPRDAVGYPSGAAVSFGGNPIVSAGGNLDSTRPATSVLTAPSDQVLIITDVILTLTRGSSTVCNQTVMLATGAGDTLAEFSIVGHGSIAGNMAPFVAHAFSGGLPVPPGGTLDITAGSASCEVYYAVSGYFAQP